MQTPSLYTQLGCDTSALTPAQQEILTNALVHTSYACDVVPRLPDNQRLEFLGDGVLGSVVATYLYMTYPERSESTMTLYKIGLVREENLAQSARTLGLGQYILLSNGEKKQSGHDKDVVLADACEAILGAITLVWGYDVAQQIIIDHVIIPSLSDLMQTSCKSYKSLLQEYSQKRFQTLPIYIDTQIRDSWFQSAVTIPSHDPVIGEGQNKKKAQEEAAKLLYDICV